MIGAKLLPRLTAARCRRRIDQAFAVVDRPGGVTLEERGRQNDRLAVYFRRLDYLAACS